MAGTRNAIDINGFYSRPELSSKCILNLTRYWQHPIRIYLHQHILLLKRILYYYKLSLFALNNFPYTVYLLSRASKVNRKQKCYQPLYYEKINWYKKWTARRSHNIQIIDHMQCSTCWKSIGKNAPKGEDCKTQGHERRITRRKLRRRHK